MTALAALLAPRAPGTVLMRGPSGDVISGERFALDAVPDGPVALCVQDPVVLVRALLALDGTVPEMLLLSHALPADTVTTLAQDAGCAAILTDRDDITYVLPRCTLVQAPDTSPPATQITRWVLTTSGTTGLPKRVPHTLATLSRTVARKPQNPPPVWGLVYDPTRFAGLQVVLQALIGGGTLLASTPASPLAAQVQTLAEGGCTHLSATPTLWRRLLMAPGFAALALRQITLGGEITDQAVIDALRAAHPRARITHIYASTEAGVGFPVTDGRAGFPRRFLDEPPGDVALRIVDDILWLRPPADRHRNLAGSPVELDDEGFIRSGDRVSVQDDRVVFLGRDNGTINVGGVKVQPEQVETCIMATPGVALVRIGARKSSIAGALVVADIVPSPGVDPAALKVQVLAACRAQLDREAVPAIIRFVDALDINAAGKLVRSDEHR